MIGGAIRKYLVYDEFVLPDGTIITNDPVVSVYKSPIGGPWFGEENNAHLIAGNKVVSIDQKKGASFTNAGLGDNGNQFGTVRIALQVLTPADAALLTFYTFLRLDPGFGPSTGLDVRVRWQQSAGVESVSIGFWTGAGNGVLGNQGLGGTMLQDYLTVSGLTDLTTSPMLLTITDDGENVSATFDGHSSIDYVGDYSAAIAAGTYGWDFQGGVLGAEFAIDRYSVQN